MLIRGELEQLEHYVDRVGYTEHNPGIGDGVASLREALDRRAADGNAIIQYQKNHRLLADGCFVLLVCKGRLDGVHTSFYDLFRFSEGKIVEHLDTTEAVPPRSEWKNENGKF